MKENFILPDIGEGITECELIKWLVKEGDFIEEDQPIADVMTDKAVVQIPSPFQGEITKLHYATGDTALVNHPLFEIMVTKSEVTKQVKEHQIKNGFQTEPKITDSAKRYATDQEMKEGVVDINPQTFKEVQSATIARKLATPNVRKIAAAHNININNINGTGKEGRVSEEDINKYLTKTATETTNNAIKEEKMSKIQLNMAKQTVLSYKEIPHFTYCDQLVADKIINFKNYLKTESKNIKMSALFIKAISLTLKKFPIMNTKIDMEKKIIKHMRHHNIGLAIDTKYGLFVPNIKKCESKNINEINKEINDLIDKAHNRQLQNEEMTEGSLTVSNIGGIGGTTTVPIINKDEVAILAIGKIMNKLDLDADKNIKETKIINISWSADHRIIDGATIARFSNYWKDLIENPENILIELS